MPNIYPYDTRKIGIGLEKKDAGIRYVPLSTTPFMVSTLGAGTVTGKGYRDSPPL